MRTSLLRNSTTRALRWRVLVLGLGCAYLAACATTELADVPAPPFALRNDALFGPRPNILTVEEIHSLGAEQEAAFRDYFERFKRRSVPSHERVADYLREITAGFEYENGTYTAQEALDLGYGNCLSLAILTTAVARLANVRVGYELVDSSPVYELADDLVLKGVHVRALLYEPGKVLEGTTPGLSLGGEFIRIDYFPDGSERAMERISADQYIARYYRNRAAEGISAGDYDTAYWMMVESLKLDPGSSEGLNTLAVIYRRVGAVDKAEDIYRYGVANLPRKLTLLRNYRLLLVEQNRYTEAAVLDERIAELEEPDPFEWFHAARLAYEDADYRKAVSLYERSLNIAPYLHEAYAGLAQAHMALGHTRAAERNLRTALRHTYSESTRLAYEAELAALSQH